MNGYTERYGWFGVAICLRFEDISRFMVGEGAFRPPPSGTRVNRSLTNFILFLICHSLSTAIHETDSTTTAESSEQESEAGEDDDGPDDSRACPVCDGSESACQHCHRQRRAAEERREARSCQTRQAEKMLRRAKRETPDIGIGDNVRVAVSDLDRARGMHRNIIGVVIKLSDGL